jgi:selenocysteine lyase/cysteine desulfurase
MANRRAFLSGLAGAGIVGAFRADSLARAAGAAKDAAQDSPADLASNEDFWGEIQRCFDIDRTIINFNNGGVCPTPTHVLDQMIRDLKFTNESPVQHMWRILDPKTETVRRDLAKEFGCDPEEIAIKRNASEAMETLIFGIDLKKGDEVIITDQNYPRMITSWEQRARREGIVVKKIQFPIPLPSPSVFVDRIREAITPRTKAIEFPHITNLSGQILPVRDVVRLGKQHGIEVFIDGAHAFAHFPFKRDDLECDYYGCSLHKWLLAPIGVGFVYIRKEKIEKIWPMMGADPVLDKDIRRYEQIGTHPAANYNAVSIAMAFHRAIGVERKAARLRYLRDRWAHALLDADKRVKLWTPLNDNSASAGIALVQLQGFDSGAVFGHLYNKYKIVTSPTGHAQFTGVRVTPNVYSTVDEVDVFIEAMKGILDKGFA